jgi:hypothetical protein
MTESYNKLSYYIGDNMSEPQNEATHMDESGGADFDFDAMADEILGYEPEEATQDNDEATEELEGEDPHTEEDADEVDEAEEDATEESEEDEDESEDATQEESALEAGDEIDMEFKVPVKIDGQESEVSMEDLVASYQTKQSQSKKGDEIAEAAKALEKSREEATMMAKINSQLLQGEDAKDQEILKGLSDKVDEAFDNDDPQANKLARQLDKAKGEYEKRQGQRNSVMQMMAEQMQNQYAERFGQEVESFNAEIKNHVSDWSEDVALKNRKFALDLGLNEQFVDSITDPIVVKVIDEYRRLKETSEKGQVKRKKAAVKRVPTKKTASAKTKKSNKVEEARNRVRKGRGTEKDQKALFDNIIDDVFS